MTQPPTWAGAYVGIPYRDHGRDREGCDCWGLVRLVIAERAGVTLPCYATDYDTETDAVGVGRCVSQARASGAWAPVAGEPRPFDVAEMFSVVRARNGFSYPPLHVGVVIAPGWLLHTEVVTGARGPARRPRHGQADRRLLAASRGRRCRLTSPARCSASPPARGRSRAGGSIWRCRSG